ncbi:hypothetical protein R1sor_021648 [Riccia sorocarpa]|uniref:U3 small nucleolar RNA-associated protein 14 n=1 Tax=Riccia sorocarpa TaxID=122646 RepID=A0ABD3GHM2_9MARC
MARGRGGGSNPDRASVGKRGQGGRRGGRKSGGGESAKGGKGGKNVGGKSGRGPRLSNWLLKEIGVTEEKQNSDSEGLGDEVEGDVYEYEEGIPQEEQGANKRFDDVERMEYELPSDFEDEEIDEDEGSVGDEDEGSDDEEPHKSKRSEPKKKEISLQSDDDDDDDEGSDGEEDEEEEEDDDDEIGRAGKHKQGSLYSSEDEEDGDDEEDDDERHQRLLEAVTGISTRPEREGRAKKEQVITEAYPESEFNLNPGADGSAPITVEDLINPLHDATGFGALRKRMQELRKKSAPVKAPLHKVVQERINRQAGYRQTNKDVSTWVPIVKRNREAPTLVLNKREDAPPMTTATLASTFKPTTDFEKEITQLLNKSRLAETKVEEAENLELNKLTVEEVRERQARLAKMRHLLFRHEVKAKRVKKIKSKTYHRLMNKSDKAKAGYDLALSEADPEAAKAAAIKQEFLRAQERMTLKHKNQSRWAKRILKRGLKPQEDDGTRDAIADQLRTHALLTRKIHSATLDSSDDDDDAESSSEEEAAQDDEPTGLVLEKPNTKVLAKAKVAILKAIEEGEEDEIPKTGVFAIPFMARALEKKKKAAEMEAMAALEQLERAEAGGDPMALQDDYTKLENEERNPETTSSGKMAFGDVRRATENNGKRPQRTVVDHDHEELSDHIDDSDDERVERSMAGGVDMGEKALQVTYTSGNITMGVSTSRQSEDFRDNGYAFDFLDNLDRRTTSYSVGMEDVDLPVDKAPATSRASSVSKFAAGTDPLTSVGDLSSKTQDVERASQVKEVSTAASAEAAEAHEPERLMSERPASSGPDEHPLVPQPAVRVDNDGSAEDRRMEAAPKRLEDRKEKIIAKRLERRKNRKLRTAFGAATATDGPQVTWEMEDGPGHDSTLKKVDPTGETNDEARSSNGASTSDGTNATQGIETPGNGHISKRSLRKLRKRSKTEPVTPTTLELATTSGQDNIPSEKIVASTSYGRDASEGMESGTVNISKRGLRRLKKKRKVEAMISSQDASQDTNSVEKALVAIPGRPESNSIPSIGLEPSRDGKDASQGKETGSADSSRRRKRQSNNGSRIEAVPSTVEPATSNSPQDNGSADKIVVSIAGRPKTKPTTSNVELEPVKIEAQVEVRGEQDVQVPRVETHRKLLNAAIAAAATSFSDDESEHAQEAELPSDLMSQQALIRQAFAGDDVEAEFEQIKSQALDAEVPQGEAPVSLPGWGQWAYVQQKRGQPAWMQREEERLKKSRDEALGKRKDSKLRHVIISEKLDKKATKFHASTVPFPFKSKDVYERSVRMPIGREFNTDKVFRDMIRPAVIKSAGHIIDPIKRELQSVSDKTVDLEPKRKRGKK